MSAEQKKEVFNSVLITPCSVLFFHWDISAGQSFELMLPVWFALTVMLSAWVLASARRRGFSAAAVTLWTMGTLFLPLIILPLYLIARSYRRRHEKEAAKDDVSSAHGESPEPPLLLRRTLPVIYLLVMLSIGALYFYLDWRSVDAHLARANQARVREERGRVIEEYRAALKLEDDAHTRNLLAKELHAAGRFEEALAEFSTAERMGEDDEELPFNIALALDELKRPAEAETEYERFLKGPLCVEMAHDRRCVFARGRVGAIGQGKAR